MNVGQNLATQAADLDSELFIQGMKDAFGGKTPRLTDQQIQEAMVAYQQEMVAKKAKEGETFLAENKKKEGVVVLPSGLQYKVLKAGTGKTPKATDTVTVNYEGRLIDKTVFDSSAKQGQPVTLPGRRRDQGLLRSAPVDEGGLEVGSLHPGQPRLWRDAPARQPDPAQRPPGL